MKSILYATALLAISITACRKDDDASTQYVPLNDSMYNQALICSNAQFYDSSKLAAALQGEWNYAWMDYAGKRFPADSQVRAVFGPSGSYAMRVNSRTMSSGYWRLEQQSGGSFKVKTEDTLNRVGSFPGDVVLCEDKLFFDTKGHGAYREYYERVR